MTCQGTNISPASGFCEGTTAELNDSVTNILSFFSPTWKFLLSFKGSSEIWLLSSIIHLFGVAAVVVWWCLSCSSHSLSEKTRPTVLQQRPPVLRWAVICGEEEGSSAQREPFCYSNLRENLDFLLSQFKNEAIVFRTHRESDWSVSSEREVGFNRSAVTHLYTGVMWVQVLFPVLQPICSLLLLLSLNLNHVQRFGRNTSLSASGKSTSGITYLLISLHPHRLWPL